MQAQHRANVQDGGRVALGSATTRGSPLLWGGDGTRPRPTPAPDPCGAVGAGGPGEGLARSVSVLASQLAGWEVPARPAHPALLLWTPGPRPAARRWALRTAGHTGLDVVKPPTG